MNKLTYKLIYTPSKDTVSIDRTDINFVCSDGNIHIRLRDYDKEEVISGFINKLTYLITYLVNYVDGADSEKFASTEELIAFAETSINKYLGPKVFMFLPETSKVNYKGIKISKNYRKIKSYSLTGNIPTEMCPYSNGIEKCGLGFFLDTFNLDLYNYLFNDSYEIVLTEDSSKKTYQKYLNKNHKSVKSDKNTVIKLW